jgi:hypothetical protein
LNYESLKERSLTTSSEAHCELRKSEGTLL